MEQPDGRARVIISGVKPEVDSGLFLAYARRISPRSTDAHDESLEWYFLQSPPHSGLQHWDPPLQQSIEICR